MAKREILSHQKKFRQINTLVTYLSSKTVIITKFFQKCVRDNSRDFHTGCGIVQCGKMKNLLSPKNVSSNHLFSEKVTFTKVLPKISECKFPKLPQCLCSANNFSISSTFNTIRFTHDFSVSSFSGEFQQQTISQTNPKTKQT